MLVGCGPVFITRRRQAVPRTKQNNKTQEKERKKHPPPKIDVCAEPSPCTCMAETQQACHMPGQREREKETNTTAQQKRQQTGG